MTKSEIQKLKSADIYSIMLFALYKIKEIPEYSALSELSYVLDKDNFLKLCEYFGGLTITIPTIDELESILYALLLYQYVDVEGIPLETALAIVQKDNEEMRPIKQTYVKIKNLLSQYQFTARQDIDE